MRKREKQKMQESWSRGGGKEDGTAGKKERHKINLRKGTVEKTLVE